MERPARLYPSAVMTILAVALCLRIAAGAWWQQRQPLGDLAFGDSYSYWILAEKISQGEAYEYGPGQSRAFRTPGYPLLLAGLFLCVDGEPPVMWARFMGAVLGTFAVGGVIWLTQQRFDAPAAVLAGVLAAIYPGAIGMSVFVLSEAPFCPLMLGQLGCWTAASREANLRRTVSWGLLAGVAAGLATLVRPSWLFFTPFAVVVSLVFDPARRRQLSIGVVMLATCALVMSPWWIRNNHVYQRFIPTTLQVGASLYDGLNPHATGASNMDFVNHFYDEQLKADADSDSPLQGTFEERLDRRMRDASLSWARSHPIRTGQLMAVKLARMWSPWPSAQELRGGWLAPLIMLGYAPLMLLAIWGAVRYARTGWPAVLCLLPAFYFTGLHTIFVGSIRYRQPAMLPLIVLAAAAVLCWTRGGSRSRGETS